MTDYTELQVRQMNSNFIAGLNDPQSGSKTASETLNNDIIIPILYEDGFKRRVVPVRPITPMELQTDYSGNPEIPTKFVPFAEPVGSYLATSTDWLQPTKDIRYNSKFYRIRFRPIVTRRFKMTENQIITAPWPIRQYIEGLFRNDIMAREDFEFVDNLERCLSAQVSQGQNAIISTTSPKLLIKDIADLAKEMERNRVPVYCFLVSSVTFLDFLKVEQTDVGSLQMNDIYTTGIMGEQLKYKAYGGFKWILSNNLDIVPENQIYAITNPAMLGRFYQLQAPQTYVKWENNVLEIKTREIIGDGIANVGGVKKLIMV